MNVMSEEEKELEKRIKKLEDKVSKLEMWKAHVKWERIREIFAPILERNP